MAQNYIMDKIHANLFVMMKVYYFIIQLKNHFLFSSFNLPLPSLESCDPIISFYA